MPFSFILINLENILKWKAKFSFYIAALERIRSDFEGHESAITKECAEMAQRNIQHGFRSRFNAVFGGARVRFNQREHAKLNATI